MEFNMTAKFGNTQSLCVIYIQKVWRGFITRKKLYESNMEFQTEFYNIEKRDFFGGKSNHHKALPIEKDTSLVDNLKRYLLQADKKEQVNEEIYNNQNIVEQINKDCG